jgi:hypothetical protein
MTENGEVVWTFGSIEEARQACSEWYSAHSDDADCQDEADTGDPSIAACLI